MNLNINKKILLTMKKELHGIVLGATGATGRELVELLLSSDKWTSITIVIRRKIDRWNNLADKQKNKLKIIQKDNLDFINNNIKELKNIFIENNYSTVFCCIGASNLKISKEEYYKIHYTYVSYCADLCEKLDILQFSFISGKGANSNSWFFYPKTKGQSEENIMNKNIKQVSIFQPGLLINRDNNYRFIESVIYYIPFMSKISSLDLAKCILNEATDYHIKNKKAEHKIYSHEEILDLS